jgi:hypothetical protein
MENIFYAALALHIAGKQVNIKNIKTVLNAAGTSVDESDLCVIAAFVELLEKTRREKKNTVDQRVIDFFKSELIRRKEHAQQLSVILNELTRLIPSCANVTEAISLEADTAIATKENAPFALDTSAEGAAVSTLTKAEDSEVVTQNKGRYIYGIAAVGKEVTLGQIGIEGNNVYTIPYQDLCAIVHNCSPNPYQSKDDELVKNWAKAHQKVLDEAKIQFGTIIPLGFDTILQQQDNSLITPEQLVKDWLKGDYVRLCKIIEKIKDKDEYGIQIFYDNKIIGELISRESIEVEKIKEEMSTKSPGMAYMYKQKVEKTVKAEIENMADVWFKDFYAQIKQHCDDVEIEKVKKTEKGKSMLLNFSCLVSKEKVEYLGDELDKINNKEGFTVRFTGPWPPYSFAAKLSGVISCLSENTNVI